MVADVGVVSGHLCLVIVGKATSAGAVEVVLLDAIFVSALFLQLGLSLFVPVGQALHLIDSESNVLVHFRYELL
jgi:hypothetical protein